MSMSVEVEFRSASSAALALESESSGSFVSVAELWEDELCRKKVLSPDGGCKLLWGRSESWMIFRASSILGVLG